MLRNYFTIAFRTFWKNKFFSLINIAGLAIGISASLVIYLIVQHEFSYEAFRSNTDRIYRVVSETRFVDQVFPNSGVPVPTTKALREEMTGIEASTHFFQGNEMTVSTGGNNDAAHSYKHQQKIIYADNAYFRFFSYQWLAGNPQSALAEPYKVVLCASRARTYFGDADWSDILGKNITYDDSITATVTGIVKDIDQVTDFDFLEFISEQTIQSTGMAENMGWNEWNSINSSSQLYIRLKPGTSAAQIEKQLAALRVKYATKDGSEDGTKHFLQPLSDVHFNSRYGVYDGHVADKPTLYGLLAVALFLLLLGCINFINLATAQAAQRAREIGIRKTMGSRKGQLIAQFLSESLLFTIAATLVSIAITPWLLHIFRDFIPQAISFTSIYQLHVILFLGGLIVLVSLLSGFYPALVLTRFQPVTVMKNQAHSGTRQTRKAWLRKSLTITQFVIAQFLIIATVVVSKQISYSLNMNLGYNKEAIVFFNSPWNMGNKEDTRRFALLNKLKQIPGVRKISLAGSPPASSSTSSTTMKVDNGKKEVENMVEVKRADSAYFDLYGMKLVAGRNLLPSDTLKEYVINETYARALGFMNPADAIGHTVKRNWNVPIVGVIADFHTKSTHNAIKPLAYSSESRSSTTFHLLLPENNADGSWKRILTQAENDYKEIYPDRDFKSYFFDDTIRKFYESEEHISGLLNWAAGLAIFISCLGLLGLVVYTTNARTKEIGVRKVLGASVKQLVSLLSGELLSLVLLAFVISAPLAWWAMHNWLQDFVYRTAFSWWILPLTGGGMLLIAMITVGLRTVGSAMANPVKALRSE